MASEDQVKETISRGTTETAIGVHTFEIVGYSLKKGIGAGKSFKSGTFTIGGYTWMLRFCPNGLTKNSQHSWLHLELSGARVVLGNGDRSASFQMESEQYLESSGYIKDDSLTIRCEITVIKETTLSPTILVSSEMIAVPPPDITAHLQKLFVIKPPYHGDGSIPGSPSDGDTRCDAQ
ncbi:hypothetical protein PR202_ga27626 [Eleusine coracana subsp. coracana]|uniref:MATH domain-containing protein n=1 Tax=Eleusine coracana subsp. coracana TaxID=191504 RepID=A0AAV5DGK4_ELECO|nr:hypothetical protein PR202_ga27626 [Eleusine coracana subsp. coracana]